MSMMGTLFMDDGAEIVIEVSAGFTCRAVWVRRINGF